MHTFGITLKNEKEKSYRRIILFFVILHILLFSYLLFTRLWKEGLSGLIVTVLYAGYRLLICNKNKQKFTFGSGYFFVFGIVSIMDTWWLGIIDMILFLLSSIALVPISLTFSSADIKKAGFPFKKYQWDEFSNVILKDNILTLDFKNNKLLQAEIANKSINEEAFNTFAKEQLNKN
jgi:hypothetical protein